MQGVIRTANTPGIDPEVEKAARQRFQNLLNSPGVLSTVISPESVPYATSNRSAKDFTNRETVDDYVRQNFNPIRGDRLYRADQVKALVESYNRGIIQRTLQEKAEALGMTPLALLNQQLGAYGLQPLDVNTQPLLQQTSYQGAAPNDLRSGAQYFLNRGFSVRAASYLAGNIQQESSWRGDRRPFDDGGALPVVLCRGEVVAYKRLKVISVGLLTRSQLWSNWITWCKRCVPAILMLTRFSPTHDPVNVNSDVLHIDTGVTASRADDTTMPNRLNVS